MNRRRLALMVFVMFTFPLAVALAQTKGKGGPKGKAKPAHSDGAFDAGAMQTKGETKSPGVVTSKPDGGAAATGPIKQVETREAQGGTKVFKFGEVEIEGRLKSPQLVYFLRRVRAEFAAGDLGHRSFMGELSETRKEEHF